MYLSKKNLETCWKKKNHFFKKPNTLALIQIVLAVHRAFHAIRNKKSLLKFQQFLQISFE